MLAWQKQCWDGAVRGDKDHSYHDSLVWTSQPREFPLGSQEKNKQKISAALAGRL